MLDFEEAEHRVNVEMTTPGRMQGTEWFVDEGGAVEGEWPRMGAGLYVSAWGQAWRRSRDSVSRGPGCQRRRDGKDKNFLFQPKLAR